MKIDAIDLYHLALPLARPIRAGDGKQPWERLETVLVRIRGGAVAGWGEASPGTSPTASGQWAAGAFVCLRDWLAPTLVGRDVASGDALQEHLAAFRGNQEAKAALDVAWWDLSTRLQDRPLQDALGGRRNAIEVGRCLDQMDSIEEFLSTARQLARDGFSRLELKFRPGWDFAMLNRIRQELPEHALHIDCEAGMNLGHMELFCRMDDFGLAMVEQPLPADDLVGHAMVRQTIRTPVCLDESIASPAQAEMALDLQSGGWVNVKIGRVGGITPAVAIHDLCHEACVPCWVGSLLATSIAARAAMALAAKENFSYPADFPPAEGYLAPEHDPAAPPELALDDGKQKVRLWSEPGLGVEPDMERIERFCVAHAAL
ncbi:MAG: hypothetical protein JW809_05105 [Pirellulales bacterium]|nr:hypothetical protein [Pirellulales bacterium]